MRNLVAQRIVGFDKPVEDTRFVRCFWPAFDQPTAIFPEGSKGIRVRGNPTPRNIVFPDDTVFEEWYPDADYPAELATSAQFPGMGGFVNLTEEQGDFYVLAHAEETAKVIGEDRNATVFETRNDVFFLVHREPIADFRKASDAEKYIAEIDARQAKEIASGTLDVKAARADAEFVRIESAKDKPDTLVFKIEDDVLTEVGMRLDMEARR